MHFAARLFAVSCLLLATGCAQITMGTPKPTVENTQALRSTPLAPAKVGTFTVDARKPADMDRSHGLRGANAVQSPVQNSFTQYLRESLVVELEAAGLLRPDAGAEITGTLLNSEVDPAMGTGTAVLQARFVVTRGGQQRYAKELVERAQWESSFLGSVAIPLAAANYEGLYRKLVGQLVNDPDFRRALAP
ncbi:MAG: hypothetical protein EOO33_08205 [Comamonadaceae bacterium]|nr:MAG: hypothetical protein EOO33_08205 [Comamonadaceae bacterium]